MSDIAQEADRIVIDGVSTGWALPKIGPLPLPVFLAASLVTGLAILPIGQTRQHTSCPEHIGGTAILCLFVPSALVGYGLMPADALKAVTTTFKTANFQYFFIACLVAGSILGMPYKVLVQGFSRMFIPLAIGTIAAVGAGILVGLLFGHNSKETFFFIIIPIVGGGLAEGVLPLSIAYADMLHRPQAELVAMMVPAALLGNVVAIVCSGLLARLTEGNSSINGNGMLMKAGAENELLAAKEEDAPISMPLLGAGIVLSCGFFILGALLAPFTGIPGPILMIIGAVIIKLTGLMPAEMELGAYQINRFMSTNLTFAILVAMGALLVSWNQLVASFNVGYISICTATVLTMIASGYFVGKMLNMYPVEAAIVTACHSGLGGTGDVAILGAADRMGLMAFAQVATRVGGAIMIIIATFLMKALY